MDETPFGSIGERELHPKLREVLAVSAPKIKDMTLAEGRAGHAATLRAYSAALPSIQAIETYVANGVPVLLYRPSVEPDLPILVFIHGGGWVVGRSHDYHTTCALIARMARCAVVSVDYRLAPEHKFPAAVQDSMAVMGWLREQAGGLGLNLGQLAVAGDSAGGNLAAVMAQEAARGALPKLCMQWLIYPALDFRDGPYRSRETRGSGYGLDQDAMVWFAEQYLRGEADRVDPLASPAVVADGLLAKTAPALLTLAAWDPLLDEGLAYANRLHAQAKLLACTTYESMAHGFIHHHALYEEATWALEEGAGLLRLAFVAGARVGGAA